MNKFSFSKIENNQLDSLVLLRGIAVIMVCFCHFGGALSTGHIFSGLFEIFHNYGKFGVHIFFVISGFIIPFSLFKGKYHITDYPRFLYKRILRLHPPYLAALLLTLIIMYFSYRTRHISFPENAFSIFKSLIYFHIPADNPVFWTLIVEAQYYLFIGFFYILLMQNTKIAYFIVMPILLILSNFNDKPYFLLQSFFVFFFIGNIGYMIYTKNGSKILNVIVLIFLLTYAAYFYEMAAFISSLFTVGFILLFRKPIHNIFKFVGIISYSVYLIHFPLGVKIINFVKLKINLSYSWLLFIITLMLTLIISWIFYKIFEEFSERLSKKIKYKATSRIKIATDENIIVAS